MFVLLQGVVLGVVLTLSTIYLGLSYLTRRVSSDKNENRGQEHKMSPHLFRIDPSSRDGWLNHLVQFLYREFQHSDAFHNFVLRKMNLELEDIRNGPARNIISKLDLESYNFGDDFPVLGNIRLSEPDGFDPDELPDSLAIDFDLNYDVDLTDPGRTPFQVSAVALITKLVHKSITVQIKVCKVAGRMRIRLSRDPSPHWYASFIDKPQLDIRISTGWATRYASTIEDFFSRHLENMIMRRHVIPEFKVRYSPFFSSEYFKFKSPSDKCFDFAYTSAISCTVVRGRSFATKYAQGPPGSCCCVSLLLAEVGWEKTLEEPAKQFSSTQTEDFESEIENEESVVDEFVNLSVGKEKQNVLVAEDENEAELEDSEAKLVHQGTSGTSSPYPAQSKRGRILAFGSKVKEMAKEKVKEKIETVNKNRRRAETSQSHTLIENRSESNLSDRSLPNEVLNSPQPSTGIRFRGRARPEEKSEEKVEKIERKKDLWDVISAQQDFKRTYWAPSVAGNFQWKTQRFNLPISRQANFLLVGVWEKQNSDSKPQLVGKAEINVQEVFAKSAQTINGSFIRKIHLSAPSGMTDLKEGERVASFLHSNRGFRSDMSFGELVLDMRLNADEDKENISENTMTQTDEVLVDQNQPKSRNLVGNIKKLWTKGDQPGTSRTTTPTKPQTSISERNRSDSHQSLASEKVSQASLQTDSDADYHETEQEDLEGVEMATAVEEKDQRLYNAANYSGLAAKNQHDMLAAFAKEEGKSLHRDLPSEERRSAIEQKISTIEIELEAELGRQRALESELRSSSPTSSMGKLEHDLQRCKDRLDSLTMLKMQYQSGMDDTDSP